MNGLQVATRESAGQIKCGFEISIYHDVLLVVFSIVLIHSQTLQHEIVSGSNLESTRHTCSSQACLANAAGWRI